MILHPDDPQTTCEAAARELATNGTTTLAGIGTFSVENGEVHYAIAPELEQRLSSSP